MISSQVSLLNKGGEIKLLGLTEALRDLLTKTRLLDVFDIHESESEALASFAGHGAKLGEPQLSLV
jgi:anti-anti-sigma regulatory factor